MPVDSVLQEHDTSRPERAVGPRRGASFDLQAPRRPDRWYQLARGALKLAAFVYSRVDVEGSENVPEGPAVYCFTHQCWIDPMYVLGVLPKRRVYFFGPEQGDMRRGVRNRLMRWFGLVVPFAPGARGLLAATHRAAELARDGACIAIAGEGRIHSGEAVVLPLKEGAAYIALRAGTPLVPMAINGTGWLGFRRRVRVRFGPPIEVISKVPGRPKAEEIAGLTELAQLSLQGLVLGFGDRPRPGVFGRWLTELFNDWPGGVRPPSGGPQTS
jgi:1-acyl-sn-glycerol-3-phosphate acyltransferase